MSLDTVAESPVSDVTSRNFEDTELTLRLPGREVRSPTVTGAKCCSKRGFTDTVYLNHGCFSTSTSGNFVADCHCAGEPPPAKAQVVGWPPVRSSRQKAVTAGTCKYVKVAVDGAPYLRKVNLEEYASYQELLEALEKLFTCFTKNRNYMEMDWVKGMDYVPTYQDKDRDWMLVGDVPWEMFIESCKRIRLMKSSEAAVLDPKTSAKSSKTNSWQESMDVQNDRSWC
ncbi:hypothetical protein SLA2020_229300 [Shorea laevis]